MKKEINVLSLFDGMSCGQQALKKNKVKIKNYYASEIDIHAINVTRKNFPKTKFIGDVTKVSGFDFKKIDLLIGGSPCFVAGTKIITKTGYKNIEDVQIGDYVLTHKNRFKKVLKIGNEKKETRILKVNKITDTETTGNHPYYIKENEKEPIWKEIDNINVNIDKVGYIKDDKIIWLNIREIIKTKNIKTVYNLEVEEDNSYTANKLIVHNCQGFSFSGKRLNFDDPRSALFFEYVRILEELREINPEIKFLLENVVMEKKHERVISEFLGVEPIKLNSDLVSAQQRNRLYWTNIPLDKIRKKNIYWKDIQIDDPDGDVMYYSEKAFDWIFRDEKRVKKYKEYTKETKSKMQMIEASHSKGYSNQRCFGIKDKNGKVRFIHPIECERCQTVKDDYTKYGKTKDGRIVKISRTQRYRMIGNAWTVDIITKLLKNI